MPSINLVRIRCLDERNEDSASEEPYVLVTSVLLPPPVPFPQIPAIPSFDVFRYGVWEDMDKGDVGVNLLPPTNLSAQPPFWGLDSRNDPLTDRNRTIFVVSLMENDNGHPDQYRALVKLAATQSLASTLTAPRAAKATALVRDIAGALNGVDLPIPFALDDDHIGTQELRLRAGDLTSATPVDRTLTFDNKEGHYRILFRVTP